jgi:hypothetical protein
MPLWVVLALVAGSLTIVAPIHPVAMTVLIAVCRHVGVTAASSATLRVARTLPGIDLVTGTSSLIASPSARSNQDIAGKVLLKAQRGHIIFLSRPGCSLILMHMCTFRGQLHPSPYSWSYAMPSCERRSPLCRFGTLPVKLQ